MDLKILDGKLELTENLVNLLGAKTGDRIAIGYAQKDGKLIPSISIGDSGNKLTGKRTVIFKGKQCAILSQYGTEFEANQVDNIIYLTGNNPDFKVFTTIEKAAEYTLSKEIILDTNYTINKINNYEF